MKLVHKLSFGFCVSIILIWMTVFSSLNTYTSIHEEFHLMEEDIIPGVIVMEEMESNVQEIRGWVLTYVLQGNVMRRDKPVKELLLENVRALETLSVDHTAHETHVGLEELQVAEELENKVRQLTSVTWEIVDLKDQGAETEDLLEKLYESYYHCFTPLLTQLRGHIAEHLEELVGAEEAVEGAHVTGIQLLLLGGGVNTILAVGIAFIVIKSVHSESVRNLYFNGVLRMISDVNQFLIQESDPNRLLKVITDSFVASKSYHSAWIIQLDEGGRPLSTTQSGLRVHPAQSFLERIKGGELPECSRKALEQLGVHVIEEPAYACVDCPLSKSYHGSNAMSIRLEYNGSVFGLLTVSVPEGRTGDREKMLFKEVARDIAYYFNAQKIDEKKKQIEEALKESEETWRSLAENAPNFIMIVDRDGVIQFINRTVSGYSIEDTVGKKIYDFMEQEYHDISMETIKQVFETGESGKYETKVTVPQVGIYWYETQVGSIKRDGKIVDATLISTDITERKQHERVLENFNLELERSNRELNDYTHIISHDLKAPLRSIVSFSNFLLDDHSDKLNEEGQEHLRRIIRSSQRMDTLIADLLVLSRVGRIYTETELADLNRLIGDVKQDFQTDVKERGAEIIVNELPTIMTQKVWIRQVFANLIGNGLKFNKSSNPMVEVSCEERNEDFLFSVMDNGIGIKEEDQDMLFKLFQRLHTESEFSGTGAGLAICKKIVESLKGEIWVESQPDCGSTFYFTLPKGEEGDLVSEYPPEVDQEALRARPFNGTQ